MSQVGRKEVLRLYKNLLRCAEGVAKDAREKQLTEVKELFGRLRSDGAEGIVQSVYEEGVRKLSFLRIVSSARRSSFRPEELKARYVYRDGELVKTDAPQTQGKAYQGPYAVTSEHLERHQNLLRRQHFMGRR